MKLHAIDVAFNQVLTIKNQSFLKNEPTIKQVFLGQLSRFSWGKVILLDA